MALRTGARRLGLMLAATALVAAAGCSSKNSEQGSLAPVMFKALGDLVKKKDTGSGKPAPDQVSRADLEAAGTPVMRMKAASLDLDIFLVRYQQSGPIAVWTDGSGATFTFRSGILIESRGAGGDLMSSAVPSPAQISGGGTYRRTYFVSAANDRNERRDYTCTATPIGPETLVIQGATVTARRVDERCDREGGFLTNRYWFDGPVIRKSREWLSPSIGYVEFERVID